MHKPGEKLRRGRRFTGPKCPDCDLVLKPISHCSVCIGCGQFQVTGEQQSRLLYEAFWKDQIDAERDKWQEKQRTKNDGQLGLFDEQEAK